MQRINHFINKGVNGIAPLKGYVFEYKEWKACTIKFFLHKDCKGWLLSDFESGYALTPVHYRTRKECEMQVPKYYELMQRNFLGEGAPSDNYKWYTQTCENFWEQVFAYKEV